MKERKKERYKRKRGGLGLCTSVHLTVGFFARPYENHCIDPGTILFTLFQLLSKKQPLPSPRPNHSARRSPSHTRTPPRLSPSNIKLTTYHTSSHQNIPPSPPNPPAAACPSKNPPSAAPPKYPNQSCERCITGSSTWCEYMLCRSS